MDKKRLFPHEHTLSAPKKDRKKIIESTKANLSPVFIIADGYLKNLKKIYASRRRQKPFFECNNAEGEINRIWKISDKKQIALICREAANCPLVIADGHHRFEISFAYFKRNKKKFKDLNYILAYIAPLQPGLKILPTHRIVEIDGPQEILFSKLENYFKIERASAAALKRRLSSPGLFCMGVCRRNKFYFLRLKNASILGKISNRLFRDLDTYVFHQLVLPLFKIKGEIEYTHSLKEAGCLSGRKKTAFLLRPTSLKSVVKISSKGFKLPQKSTYFYPKLLSGLVIRRFKRYPASRRDFAE